MARGGFNIRALARAINHRREEYNRIHQDRPLPITPVLSRILENDEEYLPYRERSAGKRRRPAVNPGIATVVGIAHLLGTTVGDLLGEQPYALTAADRLRLREFVQWLTKRFDLDAPDLDELRRAPRAGRR